MSMLAEPRRKQKWSLNPRGKEWSQDANKFGQKMLEKMGWQSGKGLGAKEDGIKEHIKISYKNDSKGMGYKESNDQWTEHETHFSALLESLTGDEKNVEKKVISLEQKSQTSRARVHYKKFTRGKDLSQYSEKDLANIFGRKSLKKPKKEVEVKEEYYDSKENVTSNDMLVNAGSMRDYFKKKLKLPNLGKSNGYVIGSNGVLQKESEAESESESRPTFGFGFNVKEEAEPDTESRPACGFNVKEEIKSESESEMRPSFGLGFSSSASSKPKKESSKMSFVSYISETPVKRSAEEHEEVVLSPKKKSKKNKQKNEESTVVGISNPSFNPMGTPVKVERHSLNPIEEVSTEIEDSLKKKSKKEDNLECSLDNLEDSSRKKKKNKKNTSIDTSEGASEVVTKKSKKVEQNLEGIANPAFAPMGTPLKIQRHSLDVIEESITEIDDSMNNSNSKKKNNLSTNIEQLNDESVESVKKSKRKKNTNDVCEFNNPTFCEIDENTQAADTENNSYEVSTKKLKKEKKKKKNIGNTDETISTAVEISIDNPNFDATENEDAPNCTEIEQNPYEVKVKLKKEKKMKKNVGNTEETISAHIEIAIDNPNFDATENEDAPNCTEIEQNPYEVKVKLKKEKKMKKNVGNTEETISTHIEIAIDNPNFDATENEDAPNCVEIEENPYEVKVKKKNKKSKNLEIDNPNFDDTQEDSINVSQIEENPYEVKLNKKKKKKKDKKLANDNAGFVDNPETPIDSVNPYEVKPKKKKKATSEDSGVVNPAIDLNTPKAEESVDLVECDLMLNIVSTPVRTEEKKTVSSVGSVSRVESVKSRRSVRFSDVTQEFIIPNNEELKEMSKKGKKKKKGLDNFNFDKQQTSLDENVDTIARTLDDFQAEIENDINEEKTKELTEFTAEDLMVGEVGNPHGENEKLADGTKLKFKYANMETKTPFYMLNKVGAKKSYKHLIKGDILVKFKNTNLHELKGYATKNTNKV
ncbi:metacaspase-3 [Diabrotica virgifera virgifera]|uniref:G-patch domain-containing protein n=1 Tax=Diabrotica virgifera virgifera TaxID=50390 RepID=A0ABM5IFC6_DIAVI|nr:metacaspase-3 [Diabrotica virgifera virgifera]